MNTMKVARLHEVEAPMKIEMIAMPEIHSDEVLVRVEACNVVQNLKNVLKRLGGQHDFAFPTLPAVFGLDVAGVVMEVGELVRGFSKGDRVYVNPGLSCGGCEACRAERSIDCEGFALRGYFGIGPARHSQRSLDDRPQGGFAQFMSVPQRNLVRIPDNLDFDTASRFGYLGTAYRALKLADCRPGKVVLISGVTGTLGLGAAALAIAMGAKKVLGIARNEKLFAGVEGLAEPGRIKVLKSGNQDLKEWSRRATDGDGVDIVIDALSGEAPAQALTEPLACLKRGGCLVNIGAVQGDVPIDLFWALSNNIRIIGSSWFTTGEAQEMADLVEQGALDLSFYEHEKFPLDDVNAAIDGTGSRKGGFTNTVVNPN